MIDTNITAANETGPVPGPGLDHPSPLTSAEEGQPPESPPRKTASPRQIAANRCNSQKSTGPRTRKGKRAAKMNALKHAILSEEVLVQCFNREESREELAALHARFWHDLQPVGPVEEMLVDHIVTAQWRLRRALTAESGEIVIGMDVGEQRRTDKIGNPDPWDEWSRTGDVIEGMRNSTRGNFIAGRWLKDLRAEVEKDGELTEAHIKKLIQRFGGTPNSLTDDLHGLRKKLQANPEAMTAEALKEKNKSEALAYLDKSIQGFDAHWGEWYERDEIIELAHQDAAVLPAPKTLDKIIRYESKLERQLFRALAQLERLQARRRGDKVPAPISVEISARD